MVSDELSAGDDWAGGRSDSGLGAGGASVGVVVAAGVKWVGVGQGWAAYSNEF